MAISLESRVVELEAHIKLLQRCMDYAMDAKMEATLAQGLAKKALEMVQDVRASLIMPVSQMQGPTEDELNAAAAAASASEPKYIKKVYPPVSDEKLSAEMETSLTQAAWETTETDS